MLAFLEFWNNHRASFEYQMWIVCWEMHWLGRQCQPEWLLNSGLTPGLLAFAWQWRLSSIRRTCTYKYMQCIYLWNWEVYAPAGYIAPAKMQCGGGCGPERCRIVYEAILPSRWAVRARRYVGWRSLEQIWLHIYCVLHQYGTIVAAPTVHLQAKLPLCLRYLAGSKHLQMKGRWEPLMQSENWEFEAYSNGWGYMLLVDANQGSGVAAPWSSKHHRQTGKAGHFHVFSNRHSVYRVYPEKVLVGKPARLVGIWCHLAALCWVAGMQWGYEYFGALLWLYLMCVCLC